MKLRSNIRIQLNASLLSVILLVGAGSIIIGISVINDSVVGQAHERVSRHIQTAQYVYDQEIASLQTLLGHLAGSESFRRAVAYGNRRAAMAGLKGAASEMKADFINLTDPSGGIALRSLGGTGGGSASGLQCVKEAMESREISYGTEVIPVEMIMREGPLVAQKVSIRVLDTPRQRMTEKHLEMRALAQVAACPLFMDNRIIGIIYAVRILNNNFETVDRIRDLLFGDRKLKGHDLGTATVFLDDVRVSTNVRLDDGTRGVGTRVSEEVYRRVVENRSQWTDKAFVVRNWYISAYRPIFDIRKSAVIGILYVGILEEEFNRIKRSTLESFIVLILATCALALMLAAFMFRNIINPIKSLVDASSGVSRGDFTMKVKEHYHGEMGHLCEAFNRMVDAIGERDRELQEQTSRKIAQSEKLASVGRLASGIAHEITNPLTGMLTYSNMLLEDLKDTRYAEDLKIMIGETERCRIIVRGLLDFARETHMEKRPGDMNRIIGDTLFILEKSDGLRNIRVEKDLDPGIPEISMDAGQMKSVISNLVINSLDAMPDGGLLRISTRRASGPERVIIEVRDNGSGIKKEHLPLIFDPFFTTKETGKGTGLGLSITLSIVERHGGTIRVSSEEGAGTSFVIELPAV